MVPVKLTLSNFTSYGKTVPDLDFTKFHLAAISGPNGAGKSSILDAITWCLWGWSRSGDSADQLIRLGADEMQVEFIFSLDGHEFSVKRRRVKKSGGNTALEFWSKSNNLTEGTIKVTQEKIISTLHLTFETFINSSFIRQGHADEFTTKGPNDRKRILADILGLSHYDALEEKAKDRAKAAQTKLQLLDYQILEFETELSQKETSQEQKVQAEKKINEVEMQINVLEKELRSLQEQKATLLATSEQQSKLKQTLSELQNELNDILTQGKSRADRIKTLEFELAELPTFDEKLKELKLLEKEKEEYTRSQQKKLELEKELTSIEGSLSLKVQEKETLMKKLTEIKSHIEALQKDSAKCPTCGQIINQDQKQKVKEDYSQEAEKLDKQISEIKFTEEAQIEKLKKDIGGISVNDNQYKEIIQKLAELSTLQEKREKLIAAQATLESERKTVGELRNLFTNKKTQVEKLELEVSRLPNLQNQIETVITEENKKDNQLLLLRSEEKEAGNILGQVTQLITRAEQLEKVLTQKKSEKTSLQKEKENFEELSLAFGKKGIQAMIIETAIPEIEDETNNLLNKLTSGRMKVRFDTQRETKTKVAGADGEKTFGLVETLDIIISDEMGERPYENYSGGEQFRVNIAIRLALSKLLTRRAGAKLQFLVIDEGFGTQDAEGRTKMVEVLDTIKNDFEKILVITHLEELKEEFPVRIEVSKGSAGSAFEVVGV